MHEEERIGVAKHVAFALVTVALSVIACLVAAEIVLRFLPVATGMWTLPVNAAHPVFRFTPDREFLFSRDWNFSLVNRGHVNNDGFVNDHDYAPNDSRPLLAVVGDSYVEAAMVPNAQTLYRRLGDKLGDNGRVYGFGMSGAPLSQYLVWAQHAVQKYHADGIAVVVVGNDYDESLLSYNGRPGLHVYARDADGHLRLHRNDYAPSPFRFVVRHSALGRYLVFNLEALETIKSLAARFGLVSAAHAAGPSPEPQAAETPAAGRRYVGNTEAAASAQRVRDSEEAIVAFFEDLARMVPLPPDHIAFLLDGARYESDRAAVEGSYFGLMRRRFMAEASARGHEVVDLQPRFLALSADGRTRFEFPTDGHWSGTGHAVAAEALAASKLYSTVFGGR